jgi:hypothetical protein
MHPEEIVRWRDAVFIIQQEKWTTGYIEVMDFDPLYRPPAERLPEPSKCLKFYLSESNTNKSVVACFYVRFLDKEKDEYYRALYLNERTVSDLIVKIAAKYKVDPNVIVRMVRVDPDGFKTTVDDDMVQQVPEGQDMLAEATEVCRLQTSTTDISTLSLAAVEVCLTY